jgi:hypothetical protein
MPSKSKVHTEFHDCPIWRRQGHGFEPLTIPDQALRPVRRQRPGHPDPAPATGRQEIGQAAMIACIWQLIAMRLGADRISFYADHCGMGGVRPDRPDAIFNFEA